MEIDPQTVSPGSLYSLMITAISPRPIAWVSTISPGGVPNLAPFSYFAGVGSKPPAMMFSVVNRPDGSSKDTLINIRETRQFVVNIVPRALAEPMFVSSQEFEYEVNEFERAELEIGVSTKVKPPYVKRSPVQFECELLQIVQIGEGALAANAIFGQVVWIRTDESVLNASGHIDQTKLDTIGRMGGSTYTQTRDTFDLRFEI